MNARRVLQRLIESAGTPMTPEAARFFLGLNLSEEERERVSALNEKASDGALSADERAELEEYLLVGDLIGLLHSRARRILRDDGDPAR